MGFVSKDELDRFIYDDAVTADFKLSVNTLDITAEALIVRHDNSQNTNYTDSYAGTSLIHFSDASVMNVYKEGYSYYNANDELVSEVPDEEISESEWDRLFKDLPGTYLVSLRKSDGGIYEAIFETSDEIGASADSYKLMLKASHVTVSWDKYMNRVIR
jgi:hypothetical protein